MTTDKELDEQAALRERGRRLAWIAAGVAIMAMLALLGPTPGPLRASEVPDAGTAPLDQQVPAASSHMASLSSQIDWDGMAPSEDPSPLSVAAYER
ncbi:MAG: hypothetical protein V4792_11240 [Pseudomonadota bacterium]